MSIFEEYTPTTDDIENSYAYDTEYEYHHPDDPGYHYRNRRAFRRWLAAHDAEVREECAKVAEDVAVRAGSASTHARAAAKIAAAIRALGGGSR